MVTISTKRTTYLLGICLATSLLLQACKKDEQQQPVITGPVAEEGEELSGGEQNTVFDISANAFSFSSPGLGGTDGLNFFVGNSFFTDSWVSAPASTTARDGLGPTFNARACASCHFKDGRGMPMTMTGEASKGMLFRLSVPGMDMHGGPLPAPNYGDQLNDRAVPGVTAEGQVQITYTTINGSLADGQTYTLQQPHYTIINGSYGSTDGLLVSPRVGQQVIGMGLLEAITEDDILKHTDENDADGDGISGRANYVWNKATQSPVIGRFGWKANQPTLLQQTAGAFVGDMGITSHVFPDQNCPGTQYGCQQAPDGGSPEIEDDDLHKVVIYISNLAVPARRDHTDDVVLQGKQLFNDIGCTSCHVAKYTTGTHPVFANLSNQEIRPYTDLLLHDMGAALADNRPDYLATGNEWRTQPLWGIGLIQTVNGHTRLLHDGRARNVEEAILWHGGEAQKSNDNYKQLSADERQAVLKFINSL